MTLLSWPVRRMNSNPPQIVLGALIATAFWAVVAVFGGGLQFVKDYGAPIATIFAAVTAGWIAYRIGQSQVAVARIQANVAEKNWKTSNEKIVLDLFDKRLAIYEDIRSVIGEVVRSGQARDDLLWKFDNVTDRAPYFFGEEVTEYLKSVRLDLIDLNLFNTLMENLTDPDLPKWIQKRQDKFLAITHFYNQAPLFAPYMKAHQKA